MNNCEPIEVKRRPRTAVDAQFSLPYTIACALVKKRASITDFAEEAIRDPTALQIASRIHPFVDQEIEKRAGREISPASIEVRVKTGEVYSAQVQYPKGHPLNQMTNEDFESKFRSCTYAALGDKFSNIIDQLIDSLRNLEQINDIRGITRLFELKV